MPGMAPLDFSLGAGGRTVDNASGSGTCEDAPAAEAKRLSVDSLSSLLSFATGKNKEAPTLLQTQDGEESGSQTRREGNAAPRTGTANTSTTNASLSAPSGEARPRGLGLGALIKEKMSAGVLLVEHQVCFSDPFCLKSGNVLALAVIFLVARNRSNEGQIAQ